MPRRVLQTESLQAKIDAVHRAIWARNEALDENEHWWVLDIHDHFVVVRRGRDLLKVPYSFDDNGIAVFGESEEVEMELEPVSATTHAEVVAASGKKEGWVWEVVVIEPGFTRHDPPWYVPEEVLAAAASKFDGVKVFVFPETGLSHHRNALKKNWDRQVGWLQNPRIGDDGEIRADLHFLETPEGALATQARKALVDGWTRKSAMLGLSIDARGKLLEGRLDGRSIRLLASIEEVLSLDIVARPAAGGKFTQLVADVATDPNQEEPMDPQVKRLWTLLQARRPEALQGLDQNNVTLAQLMAAVPDDELQRLFTAAPEPSTPPAPDNGPSAEERVGVALTQLSVRELLQASKLPELAQKRIRDRFTGRAAEDAEIQTAIDAERDYLAKLAPSRVAGLGGERDGAGLRVGAGSIEKLQAGLDRSFGLEPENADLKGIRPLGLRKLYDEITMGHDPDVTGVISAEGQQAMLQADFSNATLPRVVLNTMNRRLIRDYNEIDYRERELISVTSAPDFKTREVIRAGYFGDLPAVNPEAADYAEIAAYTDAYEQYSVGQKGGKVTITRKHIINDDVGAFAKVTGRLGRSARRTFAKFVYGFFTTNPNMQDGNAWFSVAHANLRTVALSVAELTAIRLAMYNQTEPDSGEKLALSPYNLLVPINLEDTALAINTTDKLVGSANNDANRWHRYFGQNNERIIVVPFWTDVNDFVVTANPADVDIIEVAFLNGREEPELFIADMPTVGQMFTADKVVIKIRHEYGGVPLDHRGVHKNAVA